VGKMSALTAERCDPASAWRSPLSDRLERFRRKSINDQSIIRINTPTSLYLIRADLDGRPLFGKIGISWTPDLRLKTLQTSCPLSLSLAGTLAFPTRHPAAVRERDAHRSLKSCRISGEWYPWEDALREFNRGAQPWVDSFRDLMGRELGQ